MKINLRSKVLELSRGEKEQEFSISNQVLDGPTYLKEKKLTQIPAILPTLFNSRTSPDTPMLYFTIKLISKLWEILLTKKIGGMARNPS